MWTWTVLGIGVLGLVVLGFVESRRPGDRIAPLLLPRLLRIPAFSAGLVVMTVFAAGMQGMFVTFALWIQLGQGFSPLAAGLVTTAFSIGGFLPKSVARTTLCRRPATQSLGLPIPDRFPSSPRRLVSMS